MKDGAKTAVNKKESMERLKNQFLQAQVNGDTGLMKKIKAIMDRIKANEQNKS